MHLQRPWWSGLVAAVLGVREGGQRFIFIPRVDGYIAYLTLPNERDGGINGVPLVWEECAPSGTSPAA